MANKINFTANGAPTRSLKTVPSRYRMSPGRPNISQSDGVRPAFPLMPFKHLPTSFQDINTEDYVVIPKGRIVSAITSNDDAASVIGDGQDYFGVPKGIMGLMVPANGGAARVVTSPADKESYTIPANKPIGVAEHDVFQDMRGENLNYDMRSKNYGVLARQLIKLPAVDIAVFSEMMGDADCFVPANDDATGTEAEYVHTVLEDQATPVAGTYDVTIDDSDAAMVIPIATIAADAGIDEDDYSFVFASATTVVRVDVEDETYTASFDGSELTVTSDAAYTEGAVVTVSFDAYANIEIAIADIAAELDIQPEQYSYVFVEATVVADGGGEVVTAAYADEVLTLSSDGVFTEDAMITVTVTYTDLNTDSTAPVTSADISTYAYASVEKEYSFLTFNSEEVTATAGLLLKPDYYGNFMPHTTEDAQCVGRLLGVDYRFGKDLLDTVQSVYEENPGYRVSGTGTKGVPQFLYNFAYNAITAALTKGGTDWATKWSGVDPATKVLEFCDGGAIGEAWIQLNV